MYGAVWANSEDAGSSAPASADSGDWAGADATSFWFSLPMPSSANTCWFFRMFAARCFSYLVDMEAAWGGRGKRRRYMCGAASAGGAGGDRRGLAGGRRPTTDSECPSNSDFDILRSSLFRMGKMGGVP